MAPEPPWPAARPAPDPGSPPSPALVGLGRPLLVRPPPVLLACLQLRGRVRREKRHGDGSETGSAQEVDGKLTGRRRDADGKRMGDGRGGIRVRARRMGGGREADGRPTAGGRERAREAGGDGREKRNRKRTGGELSRRSGVPSWREIISHCTVANTVANTVAYSVANPEIAVCAAISFHWGCAVANSLF